MCGSGNVDTINAIAEQLDAVTLAVVPSDVDTNRVYVRICVPEPRAQAFLDRLQSQLSPDAEPLVLIQSIDAQIPAPDVEEKNSGPAAGDGATREELYAGISRGAELDTNFVLLVVLATVVAAIGLAEDNVAVVIAAMVIAPLLGPNLGLSLGAALGDKVLIGRSLATNAVGVSLTIALAALIARIWEPNLQSFELSSRTEVRLSSILLALASGIAAVQSLTTRLASLLVGVMVAVALVPPATVLGMMLGIGEWSMATGAGTLLLVNVVSVNLAAQVVFLVRGVRPRSWLERRAAQQSTWLNIAVWGVLLALLVALVVLLSW